MGGGIKLQGDETAGPPGDGRFDQAAGRPEAEDSAAPQQMAGDQQKDQAPIRFAEGCEGMVQHGSVVPRLL